MGAWEVDPNPGTAARTLPTVSPEMLRLHRELMHVVVPKEASRCRSKGPKDEWIERTCDNVVACGRLKGKISQMKVVENFEQDHMKQCLWW